MCRIKNLAILLGLCMVITACGSSEQQKSKVILFQGDKNKKEEEHYKTTKVKKGTYEEKISATASLVYQNDKAVMIKDSNAYLDKILVKNGQKVVKGQKLAFFARFNVIARKTTLHVQLFLSDFTQSVAFGRNSEDFSPKHATLFYIQTDLRCIETT